MRLSNEINIKRLIRKIIVESEKYDFFIHDDIIKLLYILFDLII